MRGDWSSRGQGGGARGERAPRDPDAPLSDRPRLQIEAPDIPEEITGSMLDKDARARLRTLSKDNAEDVGRHLVMAGMLMDDDPELAYKHAQVALARGGRVDIVREAAALTAYVTGRWAEALKEFRTVRRLSGDVSYLPHMADCERGLGRPERAIALLQDPDVSALSPIVKAELTVVAAGARLDLGDAEGAYAALQRVVTTAPGVQQRIDEAMIDVLRALGRTEQADQIEQRIAAAAATDEDDEPELDVVVYDVAEVELVKEEAVPADAGFVESHQSEHADVDDKGAQA